MKIAFYILSIWTVLSGLLAVTLRNMIHCALALIAFFFGVALIFFQLRAEFLGAVQLIVYVGAVAVLILFAIMLTRSITGSTPESPFTGGSFWGFIISFAVFLTLFYSLQDRSTAVTTEFVKGISVEEIGKSLMSTHAIPFEVMSLLLTAALVAAVVIAIEEPRSPQIPQPLSSQDKDPVHSAQSTEPPSSKKQSTLSH